MKHPVDIHVGERIRQRRFFLGLTQRDIGEVVGLNFQQIHKYEKGKNRVSTSKLWELAQAFNVTVPWFFEGMDTTANSDGREPDAQEYMQIKETALLVKAYYRISEAKRKRLFELTKIMAERK